MKPPSFEPWLGRIRVARATIAVLGFVLVTMLAFRGGMALDDALTRGLGSAVLCYFVGWAAALWAAGELHAARIARMRAELERREMERRAQLQEMYEQRMAVMNDALGGGPPAPFATESFAGQQPPQKRAA